MRRRLLLAAPVLAAAGAPGAGPRDALAALEARHGGRLGVAVLDNRGNRPLTHRGEERFALCSTFKVLAAAGILARVDAGQDSLERVLHFGAEKVLTYSPMAGPRAGTGLTLAEACDAAVTLSDNTAGNLLLEALGGPEGLTAWLRITGDAETRLDRWEPALNEVPPGEPRDTTTPLAMAATLQRLVLGEALSGTSRGRLRDWLLGCRTGDRRLRAGIPTGWRVGDKTGTGPAGESNDVAVLWPPDRPPLVVAAYYAGSPAPAAVRDAVLAEVGRIAASS